MDPLAALLSEHPPQQLSATELRSRIALLEDTARAYRTELERQWDIEFSALFTLTNMPISRFGSVLLAKNQYHQYMSLLQDSFRAENLATLMCRSLVSVDWRGHLYDCDFNQMLKLPLIATDRPPVRLQTLLGERLDGNPVATGQHCFGCTAGQGSSCGGALAEV